VTGVTGSAMGRVAAVVAGIERQADRWWRRSRFCRFHLAVPGDSVAIPATQGLDQCSGWLDAGQEA